VIVKLGRVAQWGNSAAVRLTTATLEEAHLHIDDAVELIAGDGEIIIRRPRPRVRLEDLLAKFDPEKHRHEPMLDDEPIGRETR
jgi:antitoxin MazE